METNKFLIAAFLILMTSVGHAAVQNIPAKVGVPGVRILVEMTHRLGSAEHLGVNGNFMDVHSIDIPSSICTSACRAINGVLRYQLNAENAAAVERAAAANRGVRTNVGGNTEGKAYLYSSIARAEVVSALREALLHPQRGGDARADALERTLKFSGAYRAADALGRIMDDAVRDSHNSDSAIATAGRRAYANAAAAARALSAEFSGRWHNLNLPPEIAVLSQQASNPEVQAWLTPSAALDAEAAAITAAYQKLQLLPGDYQ